MVGVVGGEFEPRPDDLALVVAGHGREELPALRAGLEAGCPTSGWWRAAGVASGVLGELRSDGVAQELLDRIDTPAGLDIGARTPEEIALSILAKIVAVRRAPTRGAGDRARPRVRDDGHGRAGHAVARARGRDGLLLPRGLQGRLRAAACRLTSPAGSSSARAARSGWGDRSRRFRSATGRCSATSSASRASASSTSWSWRSAARRTRCAPRSTCPAPRSWSTTPTARAARRRSPPRSARSTRAATCSC